VYDITFYFTPLWKRTGFTASAVEIYNSFFQIEICLYIHQIYNIRSRKQNDAVQYKLIEVRCVKNNKCITAHFYAISGYSARN
jgi:hypothetical protein